MGESREEKALKDMMKRAQKHLNGYGQENDISTIRKLRRRMQSMLDKQMQQQQTVNPYNYRKSGGSLKRLNEQSASKEL